MGLDLGKIGNTIMGYTPLGVANSILKGTKSGYHADEGAYGTQTGAAGSNDLELQQQLLAQIQSGQSPEMANAANMGMAQNASLLGSMHGISPAAFVQALQQANQRTQGQMAGIGAAGQLGREQLLGQTSGQMYGQGLGYQLGAEGINANTASQNAQTQAKLVGGLLNGGGGAMTQAAGGGGGAGGGGAGGVTAAIGVAGGGQIDYRDQGGHVPGQATMAGDHPANDTVPAKLSPGEIVLPRSVAQAPDASTRAAAFVDAIKASGGKTPGKADFKSLLAKHRELDGRLARLEKMAEGGEVQGDDEEEGSAWEAAKSVVRGDSDAPEKINRALPDWLGGHSAVVKQRKRLSDMDRQTRGD